MDEGAPVYTNAPPIYLSITIPTKHKYKKLPSHSNPLTINNLRVNE